MTERFGGLPEIDSYNLFTEEEFHQSVGAVIKLEGNSVEKWHIGFGILLDYGPLGGREGMVGDTWLCGMRVLSRHFHNLFTYVLKDKLQELLEN